MLRSFGIFLTTQAAAAATFALAAILGAGIPIVRRPIPYLISSALLTLIVNAAFAMGSVLLELVQRAPWEVGQAVEDTLLRSWLQVPLVVAISMFVSTRNIFAATFAIGMASLTFSLSAQFQSGVWSAAQSIASMALWASASVLANVHCHKKI